MTWLVRARCLVHLLVLGGGLGLFVGAVSSVRIPFISLRSTSVQVDLASVLSVAVPVAWAACLNRSSHVEQSAVRPLRLILGAGVLAVVTTTFLAALAGDALFGGDAGLTASRDVAAMIGLVLLAFTAWGSGAAALLPVGYLIASTLFGEGRSHRVDWWAVPIAPAPSSSAAALAVATLLAGLALFVSNGRPPERF